MSSAPRELVFMVRMWAQLGEDEALGEWRGSVADIGSGMRVYVSGARDVADFITARMTVARPSAPEADLMSSDGSEFASRGKGEPNAGQD